jgi:hypothetical protein
VSLGALLRRRNNSDEYGGSWSEIRHGAEGGSPIRTSFRTTDFKSLDRTFTTFYYMIPGSILSTFQPSKPTTSQLVLQRNSLIFPSSLSAKSDFDLIKRGARLTFALRTRFSYSTDYHTFPVINLNSTKPITADHNTNECCVSEERRLR